MRLRMLLQAVGFVLVVTAGAQLHLVLGNSALLAQPDPVFPFLTNRQMLFLAAVLQAGVAWLIFRSDLAVGLTATAWIASLFLAYRGALWWVGFAGYCNCLGSLTDPLGLSAKTADRASLIVLWMMLAGGGVGLVRMRWLGHSCQEVDSSRG